MANYDEDVSSEHSKEYFGFICYLWVVILITLIDFIILGPYTFKALENNNFVKRNVLAVVLVDASMVDEVTEKETYLTGFLLEYDEDDISSVTKTPDVNADLNSQSYLKYTYKIINNTNTKLIYSVDVIKDYQEKNLSISYSYDDLEENLFENEQILGEIAAKGELVINLYVRINNKLEVADISGEFLLNITYFVDNGLN